MIDRDHKPDTRGRSRIDLVAELLLAALESEVDAPKKAAPQEEPRARASGERRR